MSEHIQSCQALLLYSNTALGATVTVSPINMPLADSYSFIFDVISAAGTTEKCDLAIQTSLDGGTTYQDWWRFTQITTSAVTHCLTTQPMQGHGEAGTVGAITTGGLNAAISANKSFANPCALKFTISGTLPVYNVKVWAIMAQRSNAGGL